MTENISLQEILTATNGVLKATPRLETYKGVGTDTRVDLTNKIFFPLKGENFDAHDFLDKAIEQKASLLIVHRISENEIMKFSKLGVGVVFVDDTLTALQNLGRFRRRQSQAKIVAITGSNGKTSSKEFTSHLIGGASLKVHCNEGSFNNHWGVPLTLIDIQPDHQVVISEMGMNHPGELTELVHIGEPDILVCTTVGRAHLEGLGTIEGVARAKEELYLASSSKATRIFNFDNEWTLKMFAHSKKLFPDAPYFTFSEDSKKNPNVDVCLKVNSMTLDGLEIEGQIAGVSGKTFVPVFGKHNITNLMVAASCALALKISPQDIWKNLKLCKSAWGRNQIFLLKSGSQVLFDGYNANPDSMRALFENLKLLHKRKFAILGEMKEQGDKASPLHFELGVLAKKVGFEWVWFLGDHFKDFEQGFNSDEDSKNQKLYTDLNFDTQNQDTMIHYKEFVKKVGTSDLIAIKGSRGMKLERVLDLLRFC
jgi:UDP-N-acetylmuramoyl-tripeptide--D-alanyl-D-alanine ligase